MIACPSRETLAAWSDGDLPADRAAAVEAHTAGCAVCRADLAELAAFQSAALAAAAEMDRALAALRPDRREAPASGEAGGPLAGLRRVLAVFRPPQAAPAAGRARGSGGAATCSYSADDGRVIVSCVVRPGAAPGGYRLSGRVHGLGLQQVAARDGAGRLLAEADLDAHGQFRLPELAGGPVWLRFAGSGQVLELDRPVDLAAAG